MPVSSPDAMPIAVRVFPESTTQEKRDGKPAKSWRRPDAMFVFDTETTTDATQRLTFGSYRYFINGRCVEEGIFCADELSAGDRHILETYVSTHNADTADRVKRKLRLSTLTEFVNRLYRSVYKTRCLLVGFNLPFDLSRVAFNATTARGRFSGGFSLGLWPYNKDGIQRQHQYRPRVGIKHIDSKRALKGFTAANNPDVTDLIPDESESGEPEKGYIFRGHFLDLRTLAFSLTDRGHTLESACKTFAVEHEKLHVTQHGVINEQYIDYNRRDVLATSELAVKLLEEYDWHPLMLQATKAYSPASIGKAYLRATGIKPVVQRQPDFPKSILGYAQSAFFGGRTSAHIRKFPVPVVYTDFLSMYPTVNSLMGLWRFVTAREITVVRDCVDEIQRFLNTVTAEDLFNPATWNKMPAFVKLIPEGYILPTRAKYSDQSNDWQVGLNHLHAGATEPDSHGMWFSLPDAVASTILTGRPPKIIDVFQLKPAGRQPGLRSVKLRGSILVDPGKQDFFRVAIEERKRLEKNNELSPTEKARLSQFLKVLANATSYGIYAEMNRQETDKVETVKCHGIDSSPFQCRVSHPDKPGEYCFPPMASLITGAARLMLALLESCVTELGGTYAMEDTDSMAIVATESGGLISCPGGTEITKKGHPAIRALKWQQVNEISERFVKLNPYDREAVPGSVLKIETDNFDPDTGKQIQLHCLAISAKRYALFRRNGQKAPTLVKVSEHGLGHLLNPTDPESTDRDWINRVWMKMICGQLGIPAEPAVPENMPAVGPVSISSPAVMRSFTVFNKGKPYADQIKPFNFIVTCQIRQFGHPSGVDPAKFHLILPWEMDPRKWLTGAWIDQYTGNRYRITTTGDHGTRKSARVKTFEELLIEYEFHPEAKCAGFGGEPCERSTVGLLQRRHVRISQIKYIGKESNAIEDVESGMVHSADDVYTEYPDPRRDEWQTVYLPVLKKQPLAFLAKRTGMSRMALCDMRAGRSRPHPKNLAILINVLRKLEIKAEAF